MSSRRVPRVSEYMTPMPHAIEQAQPLADAHALMRKHQIRHLPVMRRGELRGIISLHDLHLIETLRDVDPARVPIEDAMSPEPYTVAPDQRIDEIAAVMVNDKLGSAVVVEDGKVVGIFTTIDAMSALLDLCTDSADAI